MRGVLLLSLHVLLGCCRIHCASGFADSARVNPPLVPFALEPLRWGAVSPRGWLRDWVLAARNGLGSPEHAPFAHVRNGSGPDSAGRDRPVYYSHAQVGLLHGAR